jgi:hypothetical protein
MEVDRARCPGHRQLELCDLHCEAPVGSSAIVARNHDNHASLALGWGKFLLRVHGRDGGPKNDEAENYSHDPG